MVLESGGSSDLGSGDSFFASLVLGSGVSSDFGSLGESGFLGSGASLVLGSGVSSDLGSGASLLLFLAVSEGVCGAGEGDFLSLFLNSFSFGAGAFSGGVACLGSGAALGSGGGGVAEVELSYLRFPLVMSPPLVANLALAREQLRAEGVVEHPRSYKPRSRHHLFQTQLLRKVDFPFSVLALAGSVGTETSNHVIPMNSTVLPALNCFLALSLFRESLGPEDILAISHPVIAGSFNAVSGVGHFPRIVFKVVLNLIVFHHDFTGIAGRSIKLGGSYQWWKVFSLSRIVLLLWDSALSL